MSGLIPFPGSTGGGTATRPGYISGNWYVPNTATTATGATMAKDVARFIPFMCTSDVTIHTLGVRITTLGTSNLQLAIYASQQKAGEGPRPANVISSTASIINTSTGSVNANLGSDAVCTAGNLYWLGINNNDAAATMICVASLGTAPILGSLSGSTAQNTNLNAGPAIVTNITTPLTFNTWGDLTAATFTESTGNSYALIQFKVT